jgi:hypothetical protein
MDLKARVFGGRFRIYGSCDGTGLILVLHGLLASVSVWCYWLQNCELIWCL